MKCSFEACKLRLLHTRERKVKEYERFKTAKYGRPYLVYLRFLVLVNTRSKRIMDDRQVVRVNQTKLDTWVEPNLSDLTLVVSVVRFSKEFRVFE